MRNILLGLATSWVLIGCGGGNACEDLKKKVCEGADAKCGSWFDEMMKEGKKEGGDMNAGCKMVLDDKDGLAAWKEMAKDLGGGKKDKKADDKKADEPKKADDKSAEEKKEGGGW